MLYIVLFLHQTATRYDFTPLAFKLYIVLFLHQTATAAIFLLSFSVLYIVLFLHQTATALISQHVQECCISFYSYIKPQHCILYVILLSVVYRSIPTSNRNNSGITSTSSLVVYRSIPTSNRNNYALSLL